MSVDRDFDSLSESVGDNDMGFDLDSGRFTRPTSEPFVEDTFPDSTYDADPTFGHSNDEDLGGDEPGDFQGDAADGGGHDPGPRVTESEWREGDLADTERELERLRRRLDPGSGGDRSGGETRADGSRAGSFGEGARRVTKAASREAGGGAAVGIGELLGPALDAIGRAEPRADIALSANFNGLTSLKSGGLSLVFHAPFDQAAQAMRLHAHQGKSVRMEIFVESE